MMIVYCDRLHEHENLIRKVVLLFIAFVSSRVPINKQHKVASSLYIQSLLKWTYYVNGNNKDRSFMQT